MLMLVPASDAKQAFAINGSTYLRWFWVGFLFVIAPAFAVVDLTKYLTHEQGDLLRKTMYAEDQASEAYFANPPAIAIPLFEYYLELQARWVPELKKVLAKAGVQEGSEGYLVAVEAQANSRFFAYARLAVLHQRTRHVTECSRLVQKAQGLGSEAGLNERDFASQRAVFRLVRSMDEDLVRAMDKHEPHNPLPPFAASCAADSR